MCRSCTTLPYTTRWELLALYRYILNSSCDLALVDVCLCLSLPISAWPWLMFSSDICQICLTGILTNSNACRVEEVSKQIVAVNVNLMAICRQIKDMSTGFQGSRYTCKQFNFKSKNCQAISIRLIWYFWICNKWAPSWRHIDIKLFLRRHFESTSTWHTLAINWTDRSQIILYFTFSRHPIDTHRHFQPLRWRWVWIDVNSSSGWYYVETKLPRLEGATYFHNVDISLTWTWSQIGIGVASCQT